MVATAAPSVKIYLDSQNRLDTTAQGQVLLAELITEAVCREIARQGVESGKFLAPDGDAVATFDDADAGGQDDPIDDE